MTLPVVATVAGSDSGGGAGIQADLLTFGACGVYGCTCVVALTAQNTLGVTLWQPASVEMVLAQIDAVAEDLQPVAWKTGMLGTVAIVDAVSSRLAELRAPNLVVDPVMVAKSGDVLLVPEAVSLLRRRLLPLAAVVTPNLPETRILLDLDPNAPLEPDEAARALCALGPRVSVVKGGHADGPEIVDTAHDAATGDTIRFIHPRLDSGSTHGTGCTLSAAIAAFLARGATPLDAVASASAYLQIALRRAPGLGLGHGPLGHSDPAHAAPIVHGGVTTTPV